MKQYKISYLSGFVLLIARLESLDIIILFTMELILYLFKPDFVSE